MAISAPDEGWLWNLGRYESTGAALHDYAVEVVRRADPQPGEHALDLGTGTGNAALLCAAAGARTSGLDLADRLLGVARDRARLDGVEVTWLHGDAQAVPLLDGDVDVAVSVSALVLVPNAARSARELVRLLRPGGGRAVIGGWDWNDQPLFSREAFASVSELMGESGMASLLEEDPGWFDEARVRRLFADLPVSVEVDRMPYRMGQAASPEQLAQTFFEEHPVMVAARARHGDEALAEVRRVMSDALGHADDEDGSVSMAQTALIVTLVRD